VPATIRDFSVFEQHIEGAIRTGGAPDAPVPPVWYEMPFCYFSNPHAITGPDEDIKMAPGPQAQDLELEVAAIITRAGRNVRPEDAGAYIGGYTIFNDWSARDIGGKEVQTPFGQCKGKDFANTLGPWIVTPDELEAYRDGDRYDLDMRATINGVELGSARARAGAGPSPSSDWRTEPWPAVSTCTPTSFRPSTSTRSVPPTARRRRCRPRRSTASRR
jgi:2-keto-4-pentenoate hydratase/2-oxohepta-3-ene-1,7-dioic acid hydratase in catechol pathway